MRDADLNQRNIAEHLDNRKGLNMGYKVSVIVPIYNAEKYLKRCLDSLVNQTLKDIEIICIDDGSTDMTKGILYEYSKIHKNISVITNIKNLGVGFSMNMGICLAEGEYIGTLDSDDWVEADAFEKLYEMAQGCDVVKAGFIHQFEDGRMYPRILCDEELSGLPVNAKVLSKQPKVLSDMLCFQPSVWSAIYRKDFLIDKKIFFNETDGASYQDMSWSFKVFTLADSIKFTDEAFVHYTMDNPNSSVYRQDKVFCVMDEANEIFKFCSEEENKWLLPYGLRFVFGSFTWNYYRLKDISLRDRFAVKASKYLGKWWIDAGANQLGLFNDNELALLQLMCHYR